MLTTAIRNIVTSPVITNSVLRTASKLPFQAPAISYGFARNLKPKSTSGAQAISVSDLPPPHVIETISTTIDSKNVGKMIEENMSLNKFMTKVYTTTGMSIASSLGLSMMLMPMAVTAPSAFIWGGFAMTLGGIFSMSSIAPIKNVQKDIKGNIVKEWWENTTGRKLAFSAIIAGSGISISPFMAQLMAINPAIIPMAAGLSILTMGGASYYAMNKPLGHFKAWQSTLYGSLFGLFGMQLVNLGLLATIGPNPFSLACMKADMYIGLGLFSAFQAYDTHVAVEQYQEGNYDHLQPVVNFFLNFKNLFVRIAQMLTPLSD